MYCKSVIVLIAFDHTNFEKYIYYKICNYCMSHMHAMYFKNQVWKYDLKEQCWHYVMSTMYTTVLFI